MNDTTSSNRHAAPACSSLMTNYHDAVRAFAALLEFGTATQILTAFRATIVAEIVLLRDSGGQLELVDGLNQVTRIELENLAVNPDVADSTFEFKPPAGVDVIGGEG